jgi:hypothetical protein
MSSGNYLQGKIDSTNNAYNVLLSGAPSGYTSSGLNIGGDTSTMYGVKLSKDATNNAYLDLRADMSNKMSLRYKDNSSGTVSSMLDLVNDSALSSTSSYGATVNGRVKASSYYAGSIDTRAPVNTGVYQGYDGNVGYFNINKGSGSGGFSFKTYNADGSLLQSNLNLLASGVIQAAYYTATGNAADSEAVSIAGMDASGNLVRNYAANARFRALEARATAIENDLTGGVPTKVNEIVTRLNGLNFFSQNIATIAVFTPSSSNPSTPSYSSVRQYPPAALTNYSTTISGQSYGNGLYVASASSDFGAVWNDLERPFAAFDYSLTDIHWTIESRYVYNNGSSYSGSVSTTVSGTTYNGEWLQLKLPVPIILSNYVLYPWAIDVNRSPNSFIIAGSNDGSTWSLVDSRTNPANLLVTGTSFSISSTNAYSYYRLIILSLYNQAVWLSIGEWVINGKEIIA